MRVYIKEAEPQQAARAVQLLRQAFPGVAIYGAPVREHMTKLSAKPHQNRCSLCKNPCVIRCVAQELNCIGKGDN